VDVRAVLNGLHVAHWDTEAEQEEWGRRVQHKQDGSIEEIARIETQFHHICFVEWFYHAEIGARVVRRKISVIPSQILSSCNQNFCYRIESFHSKSSK
jgi:hypothetical protein